MNDMESRWWNWQVTERHGGLRHQYRDARFDALPGDPTLRRTDPVNSYPAAPQPECPCNGDRF